MLWLFVGPTRVYLLDFFCSGTFGFSFIHCWVIIFALSHFYMLIYMLLEMMHWLVRGLSCKPNNYVPWSTSELRVRLAPWNRFKPSSKIFYWPFQGVSSFVDLICFFCLVFVRPLCASVYLCLVVTSWERVLSLSIFHRYSGSGVLLDCIDSWCLHPYLFWY